MFNHELPDVGDTIYYKVRPSDSPIDSNREWKGKVIRVYPKTYYAMAALEAESLEEGYEGETELVMPFQIQVIIRQEAEYTTESR